ncbi:hypothetical protein [Streptomyces sp. NPDC059513]
MRVSSDSPTVVAPQNVFLDACREDLYPARGLRRLGRWVRRRVLRRG